MKAPPPRRLDKMPEGAPFKGGAIIFGAKRPKSLESLGRSPKNVDEPEELEFDEKIIKFKLPKKR